VESIIADMAAFVEVVLIDLALSADNAVAVGLAASALPETHRQRAVTWGVLLALVLRILFGLVTVQLMHIRGLLLAGGTLLFWIAWRMGQDLKGAQLEAAHAGPDGAVATTSFARALVSIVAANIALSLDNVLAVAGVSHHEPAIMVFGLVLSVLLMGVAASFISRFVAQHRWIAWLGLYAIVFAGAVMIWEDLHSFFPASLPAPPVWLGGPVDAGA
jgi:YjbE family integral membrane protein